MTAVNWYFQDDVLIVASDTLGCRTDREPLILATKVFPLPHLKSVMFGSGCWQLVLDWFVEVQSQLIAKDILTLDREAPKQLPKLATRYASEYERTTTIYQFGFHPDSGRLSGFAYRSANGFVSEKLEPGLHIKPPTPDLLNRCGKLWAETESPAAFFVDVIREQKAINDARELSDPERIGVGGEVQILQMTASNIVSWTAHRFPDFESLFAQMVAGNTEPRSDDPVAIH